jgi:hypothetical protein
MVRPAGRRLRRAGVMVSQVAARFYARRRGANGDRGDLALARTAPQHFGSVPGPAEGLDVGDLVTGRLTVGG